MERNRFRKKYPDEHMPCRAKRSVRCFVLLLALLSSWTLWEEKNLLPPSALYKPSKELSLLIEENAVRFTLSEELLQAVILVESKYDSRAVSHVGALGVMQIMPDTAAWIAKESGLPAENWIESAENVPLGAWYLDYLLDEYRGNLVLALAAYNAGRGNVDEWMRIYDWPADYADIDGIPFPETREFVRKVIQNTEQLKDEHRKEKEKQTAEANS